MACNSCCQAWQCFAVESVPTAEGLLARLVCWQLAGLRAWPLLQIVRSSCCLWGRRIPVPLLVHAWALTCLDAETGLLQQLYRMSIRKGCCPWPCWA